MQFERVLACTQCGCGCDCIGSDNKRHKRSTKEEVEIAVRKLKKGKAQGNDERVAELVKNEGQAMVDRLRELLRQVWRMKQGPQKWKNAILISLHKKQSRKMRGNYHDSALLSVPG